jgi:hypothetical protein
LKKIIHSIKGLFSGIPTDWIVLGLIALGAAFVVVRSGSARIANAALALPIAYLMYSSIGKAAMIGSLVSQLDTPILQALLFFILVTAVYLSIVRINYSYSSDSGQPIQAAIAGVAFTAMLACIWIQVPALSALWKFSGGAAGVFGAGNMFWLVLASLASLAFIRR